MAISSNFVQRNQSLQEQAYQAIRSAILTGELPPGERLVETKLSKQLQVSRTPIREALRQLKQQDLVVSRENNVLQVARFSVQDASQLYDCRLALETLSITQACQQINPQQLKKLEKIVTRSENLSEKSSSPLTNFQMLDLDYHFHRSIAESSGNLWLQSLLDQVFDKMTVIRIHTLQQNRQVLNIHSEHQEIYDCLVNRNVDKAISAITTHLSEAKTRVTTQMQKIQE